jgi:hypothetical protein
LTGRVQFLRYPAANRSYPPIKHNCSKNKNKETILTFGLKQNKFKEVFTLSTKILQRTTVFNTRLITPMRMSSFSRIKSGSGGPGVGPLLWFRSGGDCNFSIFQIQEGTPKNLGVPSVIFVNKALYVGSVEFWEPTDLQTEFKICQRKW